MCNKSVLGIFVLFLKFSPRRVRQPCGAAQGSRVRAILGAGSENLQTTIRQPAKFRQEIPYHPFRDVQTPQFYAQKYIVKLCIYGAGAR